jgi:lipoate-protein ligase A
MKYEEKIPDGKLVCISVECSEGKTTSVKITGDFFLHPEEALERIENSLIGISSDIEEKEVVSRISGSLEGAQLIGAKAEDLARIFRKAVTG